MAGFDPLEQANSFLRYAYTISNNASTRIIECSSSATHTRCFVEEGISEFRRVGSSGRRIRRARRVVCTYIPLHLWVMGRDGPPVLPCRPECLLSLLHQALNLGWFLKEIFRQKNVVFAMFWRVILLMIKGMLSTVLHFL